MLALGGGKAAFAGSGSDTTQSSATSVTVPTTSNSEAATTTTTTTSSPLSTTQLNSQQTGVIQFNNSGLSALTYPNCEGACIFAVGRVVPSSGGSSSLEAVAGVIWQLNSPSNTQAQANKLVAQAQSENLIQESNVSLAEKLAEAIESGKQDRANLLAIILAKRLGYSSHLQLLQEMKRR